MAGRWHRALVTGASSGIGEALARQLAAGGTSLVLVARRGDRLRAIADDVASHNVEVEVLTADLLSPAGLEVVEHRLEDDDHPVDLLINNAGGHRRVAPLIEQPREAAVSDVALNALAVLRLTHAGAHAMARRGGGSILQVSSATAFGPGPGQAAYVASKTFVNSLSESVRYELRTSGVSVTVVAPGFTRTDSPRALGFDERTVARLMWQDPEVVARYALRKAAHGRRTVYTSGRLNKLLGRLSYLGPRPVVVRVVARVMNPRTAVQ